jgi:energy-coupling factor transport system permease protein
VWALGLAVAASRTTDPLVLAGVIGVASWVVFARRQDAPWARAFRIYLIVGALVVFIRVFFRILLGGMNQDRSWSRCPSSRSRRHHAAR